VASRADASGDAALDPTPQLHGVLFYAVMASSCRRIALERHSSDSLERLSVCCREAVIPLHRLADLAEQILFERQCLNPVLVIPGFCESELPY
jgi:predicted ATPase